VAFAVVQSTGLVCMWLWPYLRGGESLVWGLALIILFPGNLLSAILVEKVFWCSGLSLPTMAIMEIPILIVLNGAVWLGLATGLRWMLRKNPRRERQLDVPRNSPLP
jgi:hypothetical protein